MTASVSSQLTRSSIASKFLIISRQELPWLKAWSDAQKYQVDWIYHAEDILPSLSENPYQIVILDDQIPNANIDSIVEDIHLSKPLISILILTQNSSRAYHLDYIEKGADDVLCIDEPADLLIRRINLVINRNQVKRQTIRQNEGLHYVTVLSRHLHNANHPSKLIVDAIDLISSTFHLLGLIIALKDGNKVHLYAGGTNSSTNRRIFDITTTLHSYNPLQQSIDTGIVAVFNDLSVSSYMIDIPLFDKLFSGIVVPLRHVNITIGAVMVLGTPINPLTREDVVIYEHLATHLGSAYQNVRYSHAQDTTVRANRHLLRTWQLLAKAYNNEEVGEVVRNLTLELGNVKQALVLIYNSSGENHIVSAPSIKIEKVFRKLLENRVIDGYFNQFNFEMQPIIIWLGRSTSEVEQELFQVMEGQQLVLAPLMDQARLSGAILLSVNSHEQFSPENMNIIEGIAHAAGQTLERNLLVTTKQEQTDRLEAITRSIKDGVFFVAEDEVVFCNPQFTELTSISPSQVLYQPVKDVLAQLADRSDSSDFIRQQFDYALQQITNPDDSQEYPIVELYLSDLETPLYVEFVTLNFSEGMPSNNSWLGFLRNSESEELKSGGTEKSSSHHIKIAENMHQPIAQLYSQIITYREQEDSVPYRRRIQLINEIEDQANELVQSWNNYQQILELENQVGNLRYELVDPYEFIQYVVETRALMKYRHRIELEPYNPHVEISSDERYLSQVFSNVIESLFQIIPEDSKIKIALVSHNRELSILLQSQGTITTAIHDTPFAALMNHQEVHVTDGHKHLGLYLSQYLIQLHEGKIQVDYNESTGILVEIRLPMIGEDETQEIIEAIMPSEAGSPKRKPSTVMLYDSNMRASQSYYDYLTSEGYELIACNSLKQVDDEISLIRVDLIILIIREANNKVLSFCKHLRDERKLAIPILILSANNQEEERINAIRMGADSYMSLGVSSVELSVHVENMFERSRLPERVKEPLTIGQMRIVFAQREVYLAGKQVNLTRIEYELLCMLAMNKDAVLTHEELLLGVWGPEYRDEKQYLWVNVSRLRRKLETKAEKLRYIYTQMGVGYILRTPNKPDGSQ